MKLFQVLIRHRFRTLSISFCFALISAAALSGLARLTHAQYSSKSSLWSIHTRTNTVYLLGSLHLLNREAYPLAPAIEKAYADSQLVIFETDIAATNGPTIQAKMLELGLYPEGETLYQNIDVPTRRLLEKYMTTLSLPSDTFAQFKPWFLALTLTILELQRLGFNPNYGIDVYFFNRASEDGRDIGYLETPEYQLDLLANMDTHNQNLFLRQTLTDLELVTELAGNMVRYWEAGDADSLHALLFQSLRDYPAIHDRLLLQRNKRWVATVEESMRQRKNVLFIVGVGHLLGPGSVVDLLQKKGYTVTQR